MRLRVMSDLHFEHGAGEAILRHVKPSPDEVLMLAGDAIPVAAMRDARRGRDVAGVDQFVDLLSRFRRVFYVPGNHEFYGSEATEALSYIARMAEGFPNLTVLSAERGPVEFEGLRFLGDTLWWPASQDDRPELRRLMNDQACIKGLYPWVWQRFEKASAMLERECRPGDVVMNHYLPHPGSVAPRFAGSALNRFFMVDIEKLILDKRPALWIHGHTHLPARYRVGETTVVCNPAGYPGEWPTGFDPGLVIEISRTTEATP